MPIVRLSGVPYSPYYTLESILEVPLNVGQRQLTTETHEHPDNQ